MRTTLRFRSHGGATKIYGEGCTRCFEGVEYLLDLVLVPLDLALVVFGGWRIHPPPQGPLNLFCDPGVVVNREQAERD